MPFKIIIAGSRTVKWYNLVCKVITESCWIEQLREEGAEVVCGMAGGVDTLSHIWATREGIKVKQFPANWKDYGKSAGILRNEEMAEYADVLIAIWDGKSPGTRHMINEMKRRGKKIYVYIVSENELLIWESEAKKMRREEDRKRIERIRERGLEELRRKIEEKNKVDSLNVVDSKRKKRRPHEPNQHKTKNIKHN